MSKDIRITVGRKSISFKPEQVKKSYKTKENFINTLSGEFSWLDEPKLSEAWDTMFPAKESKKTKSESATK